jgi:hypothetical protein
VSAFDPQVIEHLRKTVGDGKLCCCCHPLHHMDCHDFPIERKTLKLSRRLESTGLALILG